eukprot:scaffold22432_cov168-Amphora_coffeaeformis.AAC.15
MGYIPARGLVPPHRTGRTLRFGLAGGWVAPGRVASYGPSPKNIPCVVAPRRLWVVTYQTVYDTDKGPVKNYPKDWRVNDRHCETKCATRHGCLRTRPKRRGPREQFGVVDGPVREVTRHGHRPVDPHR